MAEKLLDCKLCAGKTAHLMERDSYPIVRCQSCGFMFAILPNGFDPAAIYNDAYFTGGEGYGFEDYDGLWDRCLARFYLPRLRRIANFQKSGRLLDVGCAGGQFLAAAKRQSWQVSGVEPAPTMRLRTAQSVGCRVYESIEEALASGEKFDCISMFEVIEHLSDPLITIRKVVRLLGPGGLLTVSTPNCEAPNAIPGVPFNLWFRPPMHISYFGPKTLSDCLRSAELRTLALDGLEHYCEAMVGEIALPRWIGLLLGPFRQGKRLRPHGLIGKLLKQAYENRLSLYQRSKVADVNQCDVLEIYARLPT
jgi:2-polyprenyl-3-methyl-5-hydroxy-6-metoxy-1,4-benzoquinol methylase